MICKNAFGKCKTLNCRAVSNMVNESYCISCKKILKEIGEKMSECKVCSKKFHACNSCGLDYDWQYYYCSNNCWQLSNEYYELKKYVDTWTQEEIEEFDEYDFDILLIMLRERLKLLKYVPTEKQSNCKAGKSVKVEKE